LVLDPPRVRAQSRHAEQDRRHHQQTGAGHRQEGGAEAEMRQQHHVDPGRDRLAEAGGRQDEPHRQAAMPVGDHRDQNQIGEQAG
jgi:hypothetical protein